MTETIKNEYAIRGGEAGKHRLSVLSRVLHPTTSNLLETIGIAPGMSVLDVACGGGFVTRSLAERVGPTGHVTGIDMDPSILALAMEDARSAGLENIEYRTEDILTFEAQNVYNRVYARFLLSHLRNPASAVARMVSSVKPGGLVVVEDLDFSGHFCHPTCEAYDWYLGMYQQAVRFRGGNPNIGPSLPDLLRQAGLANVRMQMVQPVFTEGEGKQMAPLTLENISDALVSSGLSSREEIAEKLKNLRVFCDMEHSMISLPRIFQVWGEKTPG